MEYAVFWALVFLLLPMAVKAEAGRDISVSVGVSHDPDMSFIQLQIPEQVISSSVTVPLSIYRGKTLKRTVYVWIEDSSGKRVTDRHKFSLNTRFMFYSMTAVLNFSASQVDGEYRLVAEGLDIYEEKTLSLDFPDYSEVDADPDATGTKVSGNDVEREISFAVVEVPDTVLPNTSFKVRVLATNPTGEDLTFDAWAYVYRSSRSYSGERESNRETYNLLSSSEVTFDINVSVDAPEGDYFLMVKIMRSDRKTPVELKRDIAVSEGARDVNVIRKLDDDRGDTQGGDTWDDDSVEVRRTLFYSGTAGDGNRSGRLVYESSSAKARRLIGLIFIICLVLVLAALIFRRFWPG